MKNRTAIIAATALLLAGTLETGSAQQNAAPPSQELKVNIDTRQIARPVSPYEYGMFIEHIGSLIYPKALFSYVAEQLNRFGLAYLHIIEPRVKGNVVIAEGQVPIAAQLLGEVLRNNLLSY